MKNIRKIRLKFTLTSYFVLIPYFKFIRNLKFFKFPWILTIKFLFLRIEFYKEADS